MLKLIGIETYYGKVKALHGVSLEVKKGQLVTILGANGAGKTTALKAILGLTSYSGQLEVLGRDPRRFRHRIMQDVCFITDVAVLPRWLRVDQAMEIMEKTHPCFDPAKAEKFLSKTSIIRSSKIKTLSKGMVTQLHLALVMAIDARLLVLDEPTSALDVSVQAQIVDLLLADVGASKDQKGFADRTAALKGQFLAQPSSRFRSVPARCRSTP